MTIQAPLPVGACDCHMHFYDGPGAQAAPFAVPQAGLGDYRAVMAGLGLSRVVAVQSLVYGTDNSVMLSATGQLGDAARAIAVVDPAIGDDGLGALAERGVRGLRAFMLLDPLYRWSDLERLSERIAPLGWCLNIQMNGRELPERLDVIERLQCRVIIDHTGKFIDPVPAEHEAFTALRRLVAGGNTWVKLTAPYETSKAGGPEYADVRVLARTLVEDAPERMLWGTNWPHPNLHPAPDDAALFDWFGQVAQTDAERRQILVQNPAGLFDFAS